MSTRSFIAILAASTILTGGAALADQQAPTAPPAGHAAVVKDFGKLSADGSRAYQDLTLARVAIFDGRINDAKKYVDDADQGFNKAKSDQSVFTQAEATMRSHMSKSEQNGAMPANGKGSSTANGSSSSGAAGSSAANDGAGGQDDVNKPVAWLPVDGSVSINEDYALQPAKAKAVQDANKSLAQGDRKGAMDKLKLAEVDTSVTLAVVPLEQTIGDVDQAKQLIDSGKYYEGSQKLRAVQEATLFTVVDAPAAPAKDQGGAQGAPQGGASTSAH